MHHRILLSRLSPALLFLSPLSSPAIPTSSSPTFPEDSPIQEAADALDSRPHTLWFVHGPGARLVAERLLRMGNEYQVVVDPPREWIITMENEGKPVVVASNAPLAKDFTRLKTPKDVQFREVRVREPDSVEERRRRCEGFRMLCGAKECEDEFKENEAIEAYFRIFGSDPDELKRRVSEGNELDAVKQLEVETENLVADQANNVLLWNVVTALEQSEKSTCNELADFFTTPANEVLEMLLDEKLTKLFVLSATGREIHVVLSPLALELFVNPNSELEAIRIDSRAKSAKVWSAKEAEAAAEQVAKLGTALQELEGERKIIVEGWKDPRATLALLQYENKRKTDKILLELEVWRKRISLLS